ncbi:MAG: hypothetical protein KF868_10235 [Acidobacteria bacterium]|nr:hypothetical protein [Acidobacteriota bacterium]
MRRDITTTESTSVARSGGPAAARAGAGSSAQPGALPGLGRRPNPFASLKAHKWMAFWIAFLVLLAGVPAAWILGRPTYYTESVIYVSPRFIKNLQGDQEQELQSNSQYREFVQQQVRSINRYDILEEVLRSNPHLMQWWRKPDESEQRATERLQFMLEINPVPDTYQITVGLEGPKPENLAEMVNAVADTFLRRDKQDEFYGKDQRIADLRREEEQTGAALRQKLAERSRIAEEIGVTTFSDSLINPYDQVLITSREALAKSQRDRIERESQLAALSDPQAKGAVALAEAARDMALKDAGLTSLKANLNRRRGELLERASGLGANHPGRRAVDQEIAEIEAEIERATRSLIESYSNMLLEQRRSQVYEAQRTEQKLQSVIAAETDKAKWFSEKYQNALLLGTEIDRLRKRLEAVDDRINFLTLESQAPGFMRMFAKARTPEVALKGGRRKYFLLFLAAAAALALLAPIAVDFLDPRFHAIEEVERFFGFPPLGGVVRMTDPKTREYAADQMMRIACGIDRERRSSGARTFLLTGVEPGSGTTLLAMELGRALTALGVRTTVVEANALKPDARFGGVEDRPGLAEVLNEEADLREAVIPGSDAEPAKVAVGTLLGARQLPEPHRLRETLERIEAGCDAMIVDAPPLLLSSDAEVLVGLSDVSILVIEAGAATRGKARTAGRRLERLDAPAVGVILNKVDPERDAQIKSGLSEFHSGQKAALPRWMTPWLWG